MAKAQRGNVARRRGWGLTALSLLAAAAVVLPGGAGPAQAQSSLELNVGPVSTLAIDNVGGGWGWTGPAPGQNSGHLLRLQKNAWAEVALTDSSAGQLGTAAAITDIALTGDGTSGWAVGTGGGSRLWRLENGSWVDAANPFPADSVWSDLALSADGTQGWMVASLPDLSYESARLTNGQWVRTADPPGGEIRSIALSPDGAHGWGIGPSMVKGQYMAVRLDNTGWVGPAYEIPFNSTKITVDNFGNGWTAGPPINGGLLRLRPDGVQPMLPNPMLDVVDPYPGLSIQSIQVNGTGRGWATAVFDRQGNPLLDIEPAKQPLLLWLDGDSYTEVSVGNLPVVAQENTADYVGPIAISPDGAHAWAASSRNSNSFLGLTPLREGWSNNNPSQADPLPGAGVCFKETRYCLRGAFADFWNANGGIDVLGFPITPEIYETAGQQGVTAPMAMVVQYTERARLELHPELSDTGHPVLLGLLGNSLVESRLGEDPFQRKPASASPVTEWFEETGHNLAPPFLSYWQSNGGLLSFGYPRSEAFEEVNRADNKTYLVQYFERNRVEYHPENQGTRYEFQLGLLGVEQFQETYGFMP